MVRCALMPLGLGKQEKREKKKSISRESGKKEIRAGLSQPGLCYPWDNMPYNVPYSTMTETIAALCKRKRWQREAVFHTILCRYRRVWMVDCYRAAMAGLHTAGTFSSKQFQGCVLTKTAKMPLQHKRKRDSFTIIRAPHTSQIARSMFSSLTRDIHTFVLALRNQQSAFKPAALMRKYNFSNLQLVV